MDLLPDTYADARIGHFSDGIQQSNDMSITEHVGRFSTGMERSPEEPEALAAGSFANGSERTGSR